MSKLKTLCDLGMVTVDFNGSDPGALSDSLFAIAADNKPGALTWLERKRNNSLLNWPLQ